MVNIMPCKIAKHMSNYGVPSASAALRCFGSDTICPTKARANNVPVLEGKSTSGECAHAIPPQPVALPKHPARNTRNTIEL